MSTTLSHPIPSQAALDITRGAFDLHVHIDPDVIRRRITDLELAHRFLERGLRGFVLKSHYTSTAERAAVVRAAVPGIQALGSIALNAAVGGLNALAVEVAATETLAEAHIVPKDAARAIRERADFNLDRIAEIEAEVRHDVIAFTTAVAEIVGPHARWFHYGLTSNDVVDTSQALLIQQASAVIATDLENLSDVLERRAWEFKDTPMVGRTHGIHADPIKQLINTHWHFDHTGGNEWVNAAGASILAHENTRKHLSTATRVEGNWQHTFPPAPAAAIPYTVFKDEHTLHVNNTTLMLKHYVPEVVEVRPV